MGLLTGGTKALFGEIFSALYPTARLYGDEVAYAPDGSITTGGGPQDCRARVDSATQRMRQAEGFAETDRAIYVLAASVITPPVVGHRVEILEGDYAGETFHIATIDRPPGASYFLCRGARSHRGA